MKGHQTIEYIVLCDDVIDEVLQTNFAPSLVKFKEI